MEPLSKGQLRYRGGVLLSLVCNGFIDGEAMLATFTSMISYRQRMFTQPPTADSP